MPEKLLCMSYASNLWMLKQGKVTFGLGLSNLTSQKSVCKGDKRADTNAAGLMTTGLKIKTLFKINMLYAPLEMPFFY